MMEDRDERQSAFIQEFSKDVAARTESLILDQLNEFVSRGLIVIEKGPMSFVRVGDGPASTPFTSSGHKIEVRQTVRLVLKDQAYIEALEKRVKEVEALLEQMQNFSSSTLKQSTSRL